MLRVQLDGPIGVRARVRTGVSTASVGPSDSDSRTSALRVRPVGPDFIYSEWPSAGRGVRVSPRGVNRLRRDRVDSIGYLLCSAGGGTDHALRAPRPAPGGATRPVTTSLHR